MTDIKLRSGKPGDEVGISKMIKASIKKTWIYTGTQKFTKEGFNELKQDLISKNSNSRIFIAMEQDNKNKIIGSIAYNYSKTGRTRHIINLGWNVHMDYAGQGIGTKLLKYALIDAKKDGFKKAEAEMAVKNIASWKMALKCGFTIEGTKKKALLMDDGKYIDTYIVGKIL